MVTSTFNEYMEEYEVNEDNLITSAGKFDSEHISVPYFWDCAMNGDSETIIYNGNEIHFLVIGDSERDEFPDLKDRYGVALNETESGYITAVWFYSRSDYNEAKENPDELF